MNKTEKFRSDLIGCGLKATTQRIAVLKALDEINGHPTAEQIIHMVKSWYPTISSGTIYKTLETFVDKCLTKRITTDQGVMRYDHGSHGHHHLYSSDSERIEDFYDQELNELLNEYFRNKNIENFSIEDIHVQLFGKFKK